jgi:hypothetical protein
MGADMQPTDVPVFLSGANMKLPEVPELTLRRLVPADYDLVLRFRSDIVSGLANPDQLRLMPNEEQYVEDSLKSKNFAEGLFKDGRLVAYNSLFLPNNDDDLQELHIHELVKGRASPDELAYAGGVMVDPAYRGHSLQKLLIDVRKVVMAALGRPHHFATVGFGNYFSWRNILDSGARVVEVFDFEDPRHGPTSRMFTHLSPSPPPLSAEKTWMDSLDISGQRDLLHDGHVGTEYRVLDGRADIAYQQEITPRSHPG